MFLAACYEKSVHRRKKGKKKKSSGELPAPSWHKAVDRHRSSKTAFGKRQELGRCRGAFMEMPPGPELQVQPRGIKSSLPPGARTLLLPPHPPPLLLEKEGRNPGWRDSNSTLTSPSSCIGLGGSDSKGCDLPKSTDSLLCDTGCPPVLSGIVHLPVILK